MILKKLKFLILGHNQSVKTKKKRIEKSSLTIKTWDLNPQSHKLSFASEF